MYKPLLAVLLLVSLPLSFVQASSPSDQFYGDQWYLPRIGAPMAWEMTTGSPTVVIAVIDTGIDLDHPDLAGNVWVNPHEIAGNGLDDDDNGYIDDINGWDFVDDDASPEPNLTATLDSDVMSHGTFVAGLIGAQTDNNVGYAGVMWHVSLMPLRVLNEAGVGDEETTAEAIDYAVRNGVQVINMSFAGYASGSRLRTAIHRAYDAGVVIVAALGNDGTNVDMNPVYPACFQSELEDWVLGVTATDNADAETDFTNYGASCADLSAPGTNILGLDYQGATSGDSAYGGPWNGTSAASPLVAGSVGLLLSQYPRLSPAQVFTILKLSVDPVRDTISGLGSLGVGRLNIANALLIAPSFAGTAPVTLDPKTDVPIADRQFSDLAHYSFVALGAPAGVLPNVSVYRADDTPYATFAAYSSNFQGGVRVRTVDLDGDLIPEIVTGAGPTGGPHVRLFKPYGALISEFFAYDHTSNQGVNIAVGDVDADGESDVVTAVGAGVSNDVVVWSQQGVEKSRFTVTGFVANAPLAVAVADVDDDWEREIVVFSETGESKVAIYNADGSRVVDFIAFPGDLHGVRLDTGDLDDDFRDEIIVTGGTGDKAQVRVFNKIGLYVGGFDAPQTDPQTELRLSVTDIDLDGELDAVLAPANRAGQVEVRTFTGDLLANIGDKLVGTSGTYLAAW